VVLLVAGAALERFGPKLQDEQEVLLWIADLAIETFAAGSAVGRAALAAAQAHATADGQADAARAFVQGAALRIDAAAREALAALAAGDELRTHLAALRRLLKVTPADTVALRRGLADATVRLGAYPFA
jgi:hypothetical protein